MLTRAGPQRCGSAGAGALHLPDGPTPDLHRRKSTKPQKNQIKTLLNTIASPPMRRRTGDNFLKPNQKLNAMLQRILRADYTFPDGKQLR